MAVSKIPFRAPDLWSDARRRSNEVELLRFHAETLIGQRVQSRCPQCQKDRVYLGASSGGLARIGCPVKGKAPQHIVAIRLEDSGLVWPGCPIKSVRIMDANSAVAAAVYRGLDVPARFRDAEAGPVLTGGGTVYMPGSDRPVYPLAVPDWYRSDLSHVLDKMTEQLHEWEAGLLNRSCRVVVGSVIPIREPEPVTPRNYPDPEPAPAPEPGRRIVIRAKPRKGGRP